MSVERYRIIMIFHEIEGDMDINGTLEFEMDVEIPKISTENFIRQEAHNHVHKTDFGRILMNLEIESMVKIENVDLEILKNALASIDECYKCGCEKPQDVLSFVDDQYYCEGCL